MAWFEDEKVEETITQAQHEKIVESILEDHEAVLKRLRVAKEDLARDTRIAAEDAVRDTTARVAEMKAAHAAELNKLESDHEIALGEKEHEIAMVADKRVLAAEARAIEAETKVAVLTKEVELLGKVEDVGAEVLNIQELVNMIIGKLPNIDINTISVTAAPAANQNKGDVNKQNNNQAKAN